MTSAVAVIVIGLVTGLTYALLAMGLVLVYKSSRFVNFAHGQVGAFSASLLAKAVIDWHWNYWAAFLLALLVAVGIGAVISFGLVRPLFKAPRLVVMVGTIGVAQVLLSISLLWQWLRPDPVRLVQAGYPTPIHWTLRLGDQLLGGPQFMILLLVPALAAAGAVFFRRSQLGLEIRAVAANPDAARLAGVSTRRISTITWVVAGGLSGLTAVLLAPTAGTYTLEILGPGLLVRALAAAVIARMSSLPVAFGAGLALGVTENIVFYQSGRGGVTELVVFVVLMLGILLRAGALGSDRSSDDGAVVFRTRPRPMPASMAWVPRAGLLAAVLIAAWMPLALGQAKVFQLTLVLVYALVGLSLTVLVGWSGQLSLGHFAFVGIGAYTAAKVAPHGGSIIFTLLVAAVIGAAVAVVLGLPSLRVRGTFLGVSTLAFAVVAYGWGFSLNWVGRSALVPPARLPFIGEIRTQKAIYYVALVLLVLVGGALSAMRRSGPGRVFVAVRDSGRTASAHGIAPAGVRLAAFGLSGAIATAAGVIWAHANTAFDANAFPPQLSIAMVAMLVIGGVGSLTGAVVGAVVVFGVPILFDLGFSWTLLISGAGLVATVLRFPGGLITLLWNVRDRLAVFAQRTALTSALPAAVPDAAVLQCDEVTVRFGGLTAVDAVSLRVDPDEIVGLIGSNGAGKSTLMDCVSGHRRPASGHISIGGVDVGGLPPEYRSFCGAARSFQDASLYPGLTVRETVLVSLESTHRSGLLSSLILAPWQRFAEREKRRTADELIERFGLSPYAATDVAELSTGTRRVCDLVAALAQRPRLLLLDEPTAGLAQAEVEQFVPLLRRVKDELGCSVLLIEHDMGLVMALADRIYVLEAGRLIAEGVPEAVRNDPAVIASYLGTTAATIERSRHATTPKTKRRPARSAKAR